MVETLVFWVDLMVETLVFCVQTPEITIKRTMLSHLMNATETVCGIIIRTHILI